jgi:hypothetical protein
MAIDACFHAESDVRLEIVGLVHSPVAGGTFYLRLTMARMAEEHEIRNLVMLHRERHRVIGQIRKALKQPGGARHVPVTEHALGDRGKACALPFLSTWMTVCAFELGCSVLFVAKLLGGFLTCGQGG